MDTGQDLKATLFSKKDSKPEFEQQIELKDLRLRSQSVEEQEKKNITDNKNSDIKAKNELDFMYPSNENKEENIDKTNTYFESKEKNLISLEPIYSKLPPSGREMLFRANIKVSRQEKKHKLSSNCDELYKEIFKKMIFDDYFKLEVDADHTAMKVTKDFVRILIHSRNKSLIYILTVNFNQDEVEENEKSSAQEESKIPKIIEAENTEIVTGEKPDIEAAKNLSEIDANREEDDIDDNLCSEPPKSEIENTKKPDIIILKELKNFEFFEFTYYKNILIAGNRLVIVLWDLFNNKLLREWKIEYKNPNGNQIDLDKILKPEEIKYYKSIIFETRINIYFCLGQYIININININCEPKNLKVPYPCGSENPKNNKVEFLVETHFIELINEPDIVYINTDEMIIAAIISKKDDVENSKSSIKIEDNKNQENLKDNKKIENNKETKKYINKIYIINCDNMQGSFYPKNMLSLPIYDNYFKDIYSVISRSDNLSYYDDIYFKICRNAQVVELKVIRNFNNRLYIRKISITPFMQNIDKIEVDKKMAQNNDDQSTTRKIYIINDLNTKKKNNSSSNESVQYLEVTFGNESPVNPEFFRKYDVKKFNNSIVDTLMVSYTPKSLLFTNFLLNQKSKTETILIDYNLETEIKKFNTEDEFQFTDLSEFLSDYDAKIFLDNKLIFIYQDRYLKVLSLSNMKVEPILKLDKCIDKIFYYSSYLLIVAGSNSSKSEVYLFKLHIDSKGDLSPILKEEDILNMSGKFDTEQKKSLIFAFCHAKDPLNLNTLINWKKKINSPNFEKFPIKKTIDDQALGCTETLLNYICNMEEDDPHFIIMLHEIEDYFEDILNCGCKSVPTLLDKLIGSSIEYGTPNSDNLPMYTTFDHRGSSLRGCFFGNRNGEQKDYQIKFSHIKLSSTLGTPESLKLTKCLCDIEDMNIFGTEFIKIYIRFKWASLRLGIIGLTILMWINIFLVASLVTNYNSEPEYYQYYIYSFYVVNAVLITSEIIQAVNLGLRDYFGISSINYSSILQLLTSIFIVFVYSDSLVLVFYVLTQALTVQEVFTKVDNSSQVQADDKDSSQEFEKSTSSKGQVNNTPKNNVNENQANNSDNSSWFKNLLISLRNWLKQGKENYIILSILLVGVFCLPMLLFLVVFIFTSHHIYFFIVIGAFEVLIYAYSSTLGDFSIGQRLGFQSFCVIMFVFYGDFNIYLFFLNMLLLAIETIVFVITEWSKNHLFDFACSLSVNGLIIYSIFKEEKIHCIIGMVISISYLLIRSATFYMNTNEKLRLMNAFCYRYGTYFLLAYQMTNIIELAYCFIIFNVIEFVWIRSDAYKSFFEDILKLMINWNTLDILRYVISVFWIFMYETGQLKLLKEEDQKAYMRILNWVFVLLNIIKALLGFRAFDKTRFYVRLILKCIVDIIPFLIIFVFFTLSYGLLKMVETSSDDFQSFWTAAIDQSMGGFEHGENNYLEYIMFTMGTLLIVIVMLNLLIAVLSDTFAKFLDEAQQIDYKSMIETVYEVEVLLFWRKFMSSSSKYFASFDNITSSIIEVQTPWQARLDNLIEKIDENDVKVKKFINEKLSNLQDDNTKMDKKMEEIISMLKGKQGNIVK